MWPTDTAWPLAGWDVGAGLGSEGRLLLVVLVQGGLLPLQGGLLGRSGLGLYREVARVFVAEDLDTSSNLEAGEINRILV